MATNFSFPEMTPAQIAEGLHSYDIAPNPNLRAEDIAKPQPELLPNVFSLFFTNVVGDNPPDEQLGFDELLVLENPEHHLQAMALRRIYRKARDFLDSIYFGGLTLRDFLRPHPRRIIDILSALVNYLHFRQEKLDVLKPISQEYFEREDQLTELRARVAELQKAKTEHAYNEQMEEPVVQQLQAEVNTLRQKIQEYNTHQLALRIHETEVRLKAKEKERDQRIEENKQKMTTLKSEVESELKCLADREREIEEKIAKAADLCSQSDSVEVAGRKKREEIYATFEQVCETANMYMDGIDRSRKEVDEASMAIISQIGP
uniref:Kinetochore protein Nuf2 N-terminal domain-containing protein n=1 Tax=Setaria italica TaxID=4555 RepID=K4ACS6_SETIT